MNNFTLAARSLFKKRQNNLIKILSLGIGLALGLVLISKIYFEVNYDNFYPDSNRIYQIQTNATLKDGSFMSYGQISGGVAGGMRDEIPQVEAATRISYLGNKDEKLLFSTESKKQYQAQFILADSCFFDVLPRPMIIGNAKNILSSPNYVMVSSEVAKQIGGKVVGQTIVLRDFPKATFIIGGVFQKLPENSHLKYDIIVSLSSIKVFRATDGSNDWVGNDSYLGYVKLQKQTDPQSLQAPIRTMQEKHQPLDTYKKMGIDIKYTLWSLRDLHTNAPDIFGRIQEGKLKIYLYSLLAFIVLFTAVMNYILIVISSFIGRIKEIAIYKCHGAQKSNIARIIFSETCLHLCLALLVSTALVFLFRSTIEEILGTHLLVLLNGHSLLVLTGVCLLVVFVSGVIPSYLFAGIPVASIFKNLRKSQGGWKRFLLFFQLATATFLILLLVIVGRQYQTMVSNDPGYRVDKIVYCNWSSMDSIGRQTIINQLQSLPEVASVSTARTLPYEAAPGNNVLQSESDQLLFNFADLHQVDENYTTTMGIKLLKGSGFKKGISRKTDLLVSELFAQQLIKNKHLTAGVVGQSVHITEHGMSTIVGVYKNIRLGIIGNEDPRSSAMFYDENPQQYLVVRLNTLNAASIAKINQLIKVNFPTKDYVVHLYHTKMLELYNPARLFRNSIGIAGIITLLIALIGLIAYLGNEIKNRSSEIAVRKINGATQWDILKLFIHNILWLALPALILGNAAAYLVGRYWMSNFSMQAPLSLTLFVSCSLAIVFALAGVVILVSLKLARQNPVETLKF